MTQQPAPTGTWASLAHAFSSFQRLRTEVLAGLVVGLALIPEAIAFSILAGVSPAVGLYTSVILAVVTSFCGGRPALISAATGAIALVVAPVVANHGVEYLIATVLLGGALQLLLGAVGIAKLQRFIPRSVMLGFINALSLLVFFAQLTHLIGVPWAVYPLALLGIVIMLAWPKLTTAIPAPLIAVIAVTVVSYFTNAGVPTVADMGELPSTLPALLLPDVPLTLETLEIIAPYALSFAVVGLMESLMTAKLVDDITDVHSNKTREAYGQGIANIVAGLFGGMGGCAVIGQTMINVRESRARTRLSTLLSGLFLLILVLLLSDVVGHIPMAALAAVLIVVSLTTIDWHSLNPRTLRVMPLSETIVMFVTMVGTLGTGNLAIGVVLGVVTASLMFARRVAHLVTVTKSDSDSPRTYFVRGQLFWASSNDLVYQFDYLDTADEIVIDLSGAEIWDASTVATLDSITRKFDAKGKTVHLAGLDGPSLQRLKRLQGLLHD